jgi:hypothetical protein
MATTTGPLESRISRKIQAEVKRRIPGVVIRKRHVTMGITGDPDLYGSLPGGHHFEIEVKRPGEEPRPLQEQRLAEWRAAGAITGVAHSVEEALAILGRGLYERT